MPPAPPPEDQPLVISTMDDLSGVLQGGAGRTAGGALSAEGADEGARGLWGWLSSGWHGSAITAIAATAVTGASIVLLSVTGLTDRSLREVSSLEQNFLPGDLFTSLHNQYADGFTQVIALTSSGQRLAPLTSFQANKIASVSSKLVAEAIQDKGNLSQIQQSTDKQASFQTSDETKRVLAPPTPRAGPTPPGGGPPPPTAPLAAPATPVGVAVVNAKTGQTQIIGAPASGPGSQPAPSGTQPVPTPPSSPPSPSSPPPTSIAQPTSISQPTAVPSVITGPPTAAPTVAAPATVAPTAAAPTVGPPTTAPTVPAATAVPPTVAPTTAPPTVAPTSPAPPPPPPPTSTPAPPPATATPLPVSITAATNGQAFLSFSGMVPGDSVSRSLAVTNNGANTVTYSISTSCGSGCGPLWTDATNGLQLTISRGSTTIYSGSISACINQPAGIRLSPGQSDSLSYTVSLPAGAGNSFANLTTQIGFTWTAS